ncbi:hypothetical protein DMA11_08870 [Marinilabiliaceae bacterium JC017]|nr:hypothetical protein DMA11_08870 [Marinilabiliaceae bacterium JC017]
MYQGDIIASLVSLTNLSFDIFGDTVNLAARFQENCDPMQINIPQKMKNTLNQHYKIIERSPRNVKGRGIFPMYYLHHPISEETNKNEERIMSLTNPLHIN